MVSRLRAREMYWSCVGSRECIRAVAGLAAVPRRSIVVDLLSERAVALAGCGGAGGTAIIGAMIVPPGGGQPCGYRAAGVSGDGRRRSDAWADGERLNVASLRCFRVCKGGDRNKE